MTFRSFLTSALCCVVFAPAIADQATVAVASNFLATAKRLGEDFSHTSPHRVTLSGASTGKLFAQIHHGAPYDIFLAADVSRPSLLEASGEAVAGSRFTYASGVLVLASRQYQDCQRALTERRFTHLAIANPKTAPYGAAAAALLKNLQLWTQVRNKIVYGENIGQTFQYVSSGTADLGFVAWSQFLTVAKDHFSCHWLPPQDSYPVLDQQAVLLQRAKANAAAQAFFTYLKSSPALAIIRAGGYHSP